MPFLCLFALFMATATSKQLALPVKPVVKILNPVDKKSSTFKSLAPVLAASFCVAALMYPLDLARALQMANAGTKQSTIELLTNFKNTHGIKGFFTQGLAPELFRSTWMRTVKFGLFPIVHLAITGGISETKGTGISKAIAAALTSIPEAISIMPLEIAKISLQLDSAKMFSNSMIKAMKHVYSNNGPAGFYVGYLGVQYRQAAWGAAYFASIKFFEEKVDAAFKLVGIDCENNLSAKTVSQLTSGFCAGVFGAVFNTPADTIRSIIQKRILGGLPGSTSIIGV
jgi:hypothetical protein